MPVNSTTRLPATHVPELFVLQKVDYFGDVHLWPQQQRLDPRRWLTNFSDTERPLAAHALNTFLYFNEPLSEAILTAALKALCAHVIANETSPAAARSLWHEFLDQALISFVTGEEPSVTDSGYAYARKARQVLEIPETRIVDLLQALSLSSSTNGRVILLLDDFVGSGQQMIASWARRYRMPDGTDTSLADQALLGARIFYVPLVATSYGLGRIAASCVGLAVHPAHILDPRYSLLHPESILWPDKIRVAGQDLLQAASDRGGIVATLGENWRGFHGLGLAIAFWNSVPDATMPIFYWESTQWRPLLRRS